MRGSATVPAIRPTAVSVGIMRRSTTPQRAHRWRSWKRAGGSASVCARWRAAVSSAASALRLRASPLPRSRMRLVQPSGSGTSRAQFQPITASRSSGGVRRWPGSDCSDRLADTPFTAGTSKASVAPSTWTTPRASTSAPPPLA
jgi:hypothetical protein